MGAAAVRAACGAVAGLSVVVLASVALARSGGGASIASFALLAAVWAGGCALADLIVRSNYGAARKALMGASRAHRSYKMMRVLASLPMYALANHLIAMGLVSAALTAAAARANSGAVWGLAAIVSPETVLAPSYLAICGTAALAAAIGGAAAVALADATARGEPRAWNTARYDTFAAGAAAGALAAVAAAVAISVARGRAPAKAA